MPPSLARGNELRSTPFSTEYTPMKALISIAALFPLLPGVLLAQAGIANGGFEDGAPNKTPPGWFLPPTCAAAGYSARLTDDNPKSGKRCARIARDGEPKGQGFGNLLQGIAAEPYRGKTV